MLNPKFNENDENENDENDIDDNEEEDIFADFEE